MGWVTNNSIAPQKNVWLYVFRPPFVGRVSQCGNDCDGKFLMEAGTKWPEVQRITGPGSRRSYSAL